MVKVLARLGSSAASLGHTHCDLPASIPVSPSVQSASSREASSQTELGPALIFSS